MLGDQAQIAAIEFEAPDATREDRGPRMRQRRPWLAPDVARGYLLVSPAVILAIVLLLAPLAALIALSFVSQHYFEINYSPTIENYRRIFAFSSEPTYFLGIPFFLETPIYVVLVVKSILMSAVSTVAVILLAYPMAYFLAFHIREGKFIWLIAVTLPFWTSYLLRIFAWKVMLGFNGVVNSGLVAAGIIQDPLEFLLYNPTSVVIVLAHAWAAFAILPIYVSLEKIDRSLFEAATDLGDGPVRRFLNVTLPLSMPGVAAAFLLVFIPTVGDYLTPTLVGGREGLMVGNLIQSQFGKANNAPLGAALSLVTMSAVAALAAMFLWSARRRDRARKPVSTRG
jgi:spermidine/putrescine transport system permease protein